MFGKLTLFIFSVLTIFILLWFKYEELNLTKKVDLLFIGDSITYSWDYHLHFLEENLAPDVAVEGIIGLDTQGLHTILQCNSILCFNNFTHSKLKKYKPKIIVLAIGLNNWARSIVESEHNKTEDYKKYRGYTDKTLEEIQDDAALGIITPKGVKQIVKQLKEIYGSDQKIILVGGFPTTFVVHPEVFNAHLKSFVNNEYDPIFSNTAFVSVQALANIGWSDSDQVFYDYSSTTELTDNFKTTHLDWGHLNKKGYEIYAVMLQCVVKKMLNSLGTEHCKSQITAAEVNEEL